MRQPGKWMRRERRSGAFGASPRYSDATPAHQVMARLLSSCGDGSKIRSILTVPNRFGHNSMGRRPIVIPSGCAECAAPTLSAHPIVKSAHLETRTALSFLCHCGDRGTSDPSFSCGPLVSLPSTCFPLWPPSFPCGRHLSLVPLGFPPLRLLSLVAAIFPSQPLGFPPLRLLSLAGRSPPLAFSPTLLAHPLARLAHLEMRTLLAFLCRCGHRGTSDPIGSALYYYHQLTKEIWP
jgi:hypothetical protein